MSVNNRKGILSLSLTLIFILISAAPGKIRPIAPGHTKFKDIRMEKIIKQIDPILRRKAENAALSFGRSFFSSGKNQNHITLANGVVRNRFQRFNLKQKETLTAVLYYLALQYLDKDLQEIQNSIKRLNRAGKGLQKQIKMIQNKNPILKQNINRSTPPPLKFHPYDGKTVKKRTGNLNIEYTEPPTGSNDNDLLGETEAIYDVGDTVTVQELKSMLDDLKGKLDGMNALSEMTSLRLQMTMDRRSKFISTLSQMMKKFSSTQDPLVQNNK